MSSEIWRVHTEKVGSLEAFKSERDMESFLLNNSAILGCWDPEAASSVPALMRDQVSTLTDNLGRGRMDLVGIARTEEAFELRIFELKNVEITEPAVVQLDAYIKGWGLQESAKDRVRKWIMSLQLDDVDEADMQKLVDKPVGVLVGPKFSPDAIIKAQSLKIRGVRLARFKSGPRSEYYVIIEDQVGKVIESARRGWSWQLLIQMGLLNKDDSLTICHENNTLRATPDPSTLGWYKKKVIFDPISRATLLEKEKEISAKAIDSKLKWPIKTLESLKNGEGIFLSNATGLCYLAFGGPTGSYWVPNWWWVKEKTGQRLELLVNQFYEKQESEAEG
jgi:hypothetical protein